MGSGYPTAERAGEARPLVWRKSRKSQPGDCVEAARLGDVVYVRDSKDQTGPRLKFTFEQWEAFVGQILGEAFE